MSFYMQAAAVKKVGESIAETTEKAKSLGNIMALQLPKLFQKNNDELLRIMDSFKTIRKHIDVTTIDHKKLSDDVIKNIDRVKTEQDVLVKVTKESHEIIRKNFYATGKVSGEVHETVVKNTEEIEKTSVTTKSQVQQLVEDLKNTDMWAPYIKTIERDVRRLLEIQAHGGPANASEFYDVQNINNSNAMYQDMLRRFAGGSGANLAGSQWDAWLQQIRKDWEAERKGGKSKGDPTSLGSNSSTSGTSGSTTSVGTGIASGRL